MPTKKRAKKATKKKPARRPAKRKTTTRRKPARVVSGQIRRFDGHPYHLHPKKWSKKSNAQKFARLYRATRPDFHARVVKIGSVYRVYCNPAGCTTAGWPSIKGAKARNNARKYYYYQLHLENVGRRASYRNDKRKPSVAKDRRLQAVAKRAARNKRRGRQVAPF